MPGSVTAAKRAETILQHEGMQHWLVQTLNNLLDGCQIISFDFRYLYVNKVVVRQARHTKEELLGHTMMEMYPGIENTEMFRNLKNCMKTRRLHSMENEFVFPDGSRRWFELRMEPVPEGVLIFSEDISRRKQYEIDLKRAKDEILLEKIRVQAILENIGEGLMAIDPDGKVMMMNRAAEKLLGRRTRELQGKPLTSVPLFDPDGRRLPVHERPIYLALKNGVMTGPSFGEYSFRHKSGRQFPVDLTTTPIKLNKQIIGAIEVFRDVSKEQEIDKAKSEFVSIASHQLRTPLGIAKWYLEALQAGDYLSKLPQPAPEYFRQIYKSNERVLAVVRDLLSVSRIDQGRIKDAPALTDIRQLVRATVEEMAIAATHKHVRLTLIIQPAQAVPLRIDALRLHEVVQNLIANALEYTPAGGRVDVSLRTRGAHMLISVSDTGMGISEADQAKLFGKFFRSQQAAAKNADGSGLGLYIVKSYVQEWGGDITVNSREGHGSIFTIRLPLKRRQYEKNINS